MDRREPPAGPPHGGVRISRHCAGRQIPLTLQNLIAASYAVFVPVVDLLQAIFHLFRHEALSDSTPSKHGEIRPRAQYGIGESSRFTLFLGR